MSEASICNMLKWFEQQPKSTLSSFYQERSGSAQTSVYVKTINFVEHDLLIVCSKKIFLKITLDLLK